MALGTLLRDATIALKGPAVFGFHQDPAVTETRRDELAVASRTAWPRPLEQG